MSSFFEFFRKQSPFEKSLFQSSIMNAQSDTVDLTDIKLMLQGFPRSVEEEQLVQSMTIMQIFKEFIRLIPPQANSHCRLKILITCNVLIGDMNLVNGQAGEQRGMTVIFMSGQTKIKKNAKDVMNHFTHSYQGVVQKVAHNQDLLMKSKIQSGSGLLFKNLSQSLTMQYKVVNLLNYIFSMRDIFEIAALTQTHIAVMEAYLLVWNDTIALFLFFERFILQFLDCYQQMDQREAISVYELFRDFLVSCERIKEFYNVNFKFPRQTNLKEPRWFQIQKKQIEEVNLFFQNVKMFSSCRSKGEAKMALSNSIGRLAQTSDREQRRSHSQIQKKMSETSVLYKNRQQSVGGLVQYTFETEQAARQQSQFG